MGSRAFLMVLSRIMPSALGRTILSLRAPERSAFSGRERSISLSILKHSFIASATERPLFRFVGSTVVHLFSAELSAELFGVLSAQWCARAFGSATFDLWLRDQK